MKALFFLVFLLPLSLRAGDAAEAAFSKGNTAYVAGENAVNPDEAQARYKEAAEAYRAAIGESGGSWAQYYNLGNALFRLGDFGGAALAYEKAFATDPLRPEARDNLAAVRRAAGLSPERANSGIERFGTRLPFRYLLWTAVLAGWGFAAFLVLPFLHGGHRLGSVAGLVGCLALFAAAVGGLFGWHLEARWQIVTHPGAQLLAAPDDRASVVGALAPATGVETVRRNGDWLFVHSETGAEGWTKASDCEPVWKK